MKKTIGLIGGATLAFALAGCGGSDDKPAAADGAKVATASGWDATNACALLDKAAVGAALNDPVTETSVSLVHQASGSEAATSECTYMLTSGSRASLMTRNSPIADNTPEAMAMARKTSEETVKAFGMSVEDVPGVGINASFVPGINQLNAYLDDKRFVILTISSAPAATAKATAIDLVGKIKK